jgi:hypothetical protein
MKRVEFLKDVATICLGMLALNIVMYIEAL